MHPPLGEVLLKGKLPHSHHPTNSQSKAHCAWEILTLPNTFWSLFQAHAESRITQTSAGAQRVGEVLHQGGVPRAHSPTRSSGSVSS